MFYRREAPYNHVIGNLGGQNTLSYLDYLRTNRHPHTVYNKVGIISWKSAN